METRKPAPQYKMGIKKYLAEHEFLQLESTLIKYEAEDFRDTTLLWLLIHTGARATEGLNVHATDLDPHGGLVFIRGIKGSNDRELPLPKWLFDRLIKLSKESGAGPIFKISYKRLYQIWDQYRSCKKSVKSLRHTYAIQLYRRTKDIRLVQHALGHRNISNTLIYSDYLYSQGELRKDMNIREESPITRKGA